MLVSYFTFIFKNSIKVVTKTRANTHLHELSPDRLDVVVEEVGLEVVYTQLQGAKALADQSL